MTYDICEKGIVTVMKKVVGLHFWEGKAEVCWCDEDSIVTGAIELPVEIRKFSILRNEMAFRKAFETVTEFLSSQAGIDDFDSVLCVPDYFGMKELTTIFKMADEAGISVLKTVTETTAMAMHVLGEYGLTDRIITAFISGRCLGMAEFDLSRGVVDKTDTYVAGIWNNSSLMKTEFAHSYSRRMLDRTDAICVFYAGTMNDCLQFDQVMKVYVQRSEEFINREIEIKMLDSNVLIEGLGFLCGKEEGLPAFREVSFTDIITPYKMTISVNREMFSGRNNKMFGEEILSIILNSIIKDLILSPYTLLIHRTLFRNIILKFRTFILICY